MEFQLSLANLLAKPLLEENLYVAFVVYYQYFHHLKYKRSFYDSGSPTKKVVPFPSLEETSRLPPCPLVTMS